MLHFSLLDGTTWYPVLKDAEPMSILRFTAFWATILLAIAVFALMFAFKGERRKTYLRVAMVAGMVYACVLGALFLIFTFLDDGITLILFVPLLVLIATVMTGAIVLTFKRTKVSYGVCGALFGAALIATLVCMYFHYTSGDAADTNGLPNGNADVNSLALYIAAAALVVVVVALAFLCDIGRKRSTDAKAISYAAVCIAMSYALSYIRIVKMPQGGSITIASLLPLMIYAYMFGTRKGVLAGFIYGVLQAFQDPTILHPAQFILDYPAAFACIGLAGMFSNVKALDKVAPVQFALGAIVAGAARFASHFLSGWFAFSAWAGDQPAWLYSLTYQAGYVLPDLAIVVVAGVLVFCSPAVVKAARRYRDGKKA